MFWDKIAEKNPYDKRADMPYHKGRWKPVRFCTANISVPRVISFLCSSVDWCRGGLSWGCRKDSLGYSGYVLLTWRPPDRSEALRANLLWKACLRVQENSHESLSPHYWADRSQHLAPGSVSGKEGLPHLRGGREAWACPGAARHSPGLSLPCWTTSLCHKPSADSSKEGEAVVVRTPKKPKLELGRYLSTVSPSARRFLNYYNFSRKMRSYWRESSGGLWGWWGDWSISPTRRGGGSWASSAWRREGWEGT